MAGEEDIGTREGELPRGFFLSSISLEDKVQALLTNNPMDFSSWTSLIMKIEETYPDNIDIISRVYESFLSEFPLCYGYWEKYATHKARLCSIDKVMEVYEEAVRAATYSVDVWANYCSFAMQFYEDLDDVRRLYDRGLASVGRDFRCNTLWDKCISFEHSHKQWNHLVHIYIRSLRFPTKRLHSYYQSFKDLVAIWEDEMNCQNIAMEPLEAAVRCELGELNTHSDSEIRNLIYDLLGQEVGLLKPRTLKKILTIGEYFYQKSANMDDKISFYESQIRRPYFHIKPLDDRQLQIWHHYLDFVEMQGDFDWTVKLYERCLIPCANYPEFWVRYIECMEARGGREIANLALARASKTFLKGIPQFHHYCSKVKEHIGDAHGARTPFLDGNLVFSSNFVDRVNQQANMEKRLGNIEAAYSIYERAMKMVKEQDVQTFSVLHMHFARFKYVVTGDLSAAKEVFVEGISRAPYCKSLFEGLITFIALHGGKGQIGAVDSIVGHAIVPEPGASLALSSCDREDVSRLFLEFVDLCGTIHEIRKAWSRHIKLFPSVERSITSFSANINGIGVLEKANERNCVQDNDYEDGIGDSDKQLLLEDAQSSKKNLDLLLDGPALAAKSHSEVASNSTNGNVEQMQMSENAKMLSKHVSTERPEGTDELLYEAQTVSPTSADGNMEQTQMSENTKLAPKHELIELPEGTDELLHEAQTLSPNLRGPSGCLEAQYHTQPMPDCESHDDLRPPIIDKVFISHPDDDNQQSYPTTSHDDNGNPTTSHDDNAIPSPSDQTDHNCDGDEVDAAQLFSHKNTKSVMPAIVDTPADNDKNLQLAEVNTLVQNQQHPQAPTNTICPQNMGNWPQVHYGVQAYEQQSRFPGYSQTQQPQQWQIPMQLQHPHSGVNSQVPTVQAHACQQHLWQVNTQTTNQLQGQYQMATPQVYPAGTLVWQAPNVQHNFMAGGQSQLVTQMVSQAHVYQQPLQSNEQHGCSQDGHGVSSQFWHYYQQQLYHIQQQQQQYIQLQNPKQHQQQNGPHQLQQLQQNILQQLQQQNQQQTNHLQPQERQVQQQQLHQLQHPQLAHHSQPCQPNKLQESLQQQDLPQPPQQDQLQQYVQHQLQQHHLPHLFQQQQNQLLLRHQEQQQQIFLQQQHLLLQQQQQQTDTSPAAQRLNSEHYVEVQAATQMVQEATQISEQTGSVHKMTQQQSVSEQ